ncbi:hypothetical protein U1Q18_047411, partial [Sarracenia purpurea var. burkii]
MRQIFFALLILVGLLVGAHAAFHIHFTPVTIHIIDRVPNNPTTLTVHCQSKDNDIGTHVLSTGQEFAWTFKPDILGTTLYFCHFYWGSKDTSFDVYNRKHIDPECQKLGGFRDCYWEARTD